MAAGQVSGANSHTYRRGEQPRLANKFIDKNKIKKEFKNLKTSH